MKFTRFLWVLVLASGLANAVDNDGTITYQAQIKQNGVPANGTFDFQFRLFTDGTVGVGSPVGSIKTVDNVALANGQLSTSLNFGPPTLYTGTQLFLEIGIRDGSSNQAYTLLNPRQRLTEVPYASFADHADFAAVTGADSVNSASIVNGSIASADVDSAQIQRRSATMTTTCAGANQSIKTINADGTVTCETDDVGAAGGGITSITAGTGLSGGTITTSGTIAIASGGVGATQINSTQVQRRNVAMAIGCAGSQQSIKTINEDGSVTCEIDDLSGGTGGSGWDLAGNSGTNSSTNFIGTIDNQPIVIRAFNDRAAQFQKVTDSSAQTGVNVLLGSSANTIAGGVTAATIGGGGFSVPTAQNNSITASGGTVSGGFKNTVGALGGAVGGGFINSAMGQASVVAGGSQNMASNIFTTIAGGTANTASGQFASVLAGKGSTAAANYSTTIGNCANVNSADQGAIVISARSAATCSPVNSNGANTVTVVAGGSGGVVLALGSGAWSSLSDRNSKHGVEPVNSDSILNGVLAMPIATWTYNSQEDGIRHMGPMAQDFHSAFRLGEDEKRINSVDIDGVALAAIQGLNAKLERENGELRTKNEELEQRLIRLEQTLLGTERNAGR